jgi:hypothetical protein
MNTAQAPTCLHCERAPAETPPGLCIACFVAPGVRDLYVRRRRGWTWQWEQHLRRLTGRARLGLPLFDDEPSS